MPAAEDVGSMKVEYGVEVKQALNHLNDMGRYLEMVAAAAEANAEAVDRMSESVGGDLEKATSKYEKYAAATEDYLKKVKHGWLVVTAAAMGMMYGLIRASSYGSIYMKQFGAATRMLADKIMEDSGLSDTIQMLAENFMDFTDKIDKEGYFDAIISEIEDFVRWWDTVDWKLKAVIITVGLVAAAFTVLASAIALVKIGAFISAGWLALGTIFTWIAGTAVGGWLIATLTTIGATLATVGTALAGLISLSVLVAVALIALAAAVVYLWSKTEYGQKVIGDLILAWETFKESWSEIGFIGALGEAFGNLLEWFKADKWIRTGSPIDNFLVWIKDGFNSLISGALPWGKTFVTNLVDGISSKISWLHSVMVDVYDTVKDKIWALIVAAFPWGSTVLSDFIAGVRSWLGSLSSTAIDIYNTISSKIYDLIAVAWSWGSNFLSELVAGVKSWMNKWFNVGVDIYNTISTAIWDAVSGAWGWGANFVSNLVDGVKGKLPTFDSIFDTKIPKTIEDGMDTSARKTRDGGKKIIEEFEGMDRLIETDMDGMFSHWDTSVGNMDTGDTLERLYEAFHGTGTELEAIFTKLFVSWNDHIDNMNTDIKIDFEANWTNHWNNGGSWGNGGYDAASWSIGWAAGGTWANGGGGWSNSWNNGGGWGNGGYDAASWSIGWTAGAIGGHVARSGTATIHQGEDIVRLKALMSGVKEGQTGQNIVFSPTINVHVDPAQSRDGRVIGKKVSDEIAKEVRRIMPIR